MKLKFKARYLIMLIVFISACSLQPPGALPTSADPASLTQSSPQVTETAGGSPTEAGPEPPAASETPPGTVQGSAADPMPGCTVATQTSTSQVVPQSAFAAVQEDDWSDGPADAKVTIIVYTDFQCAPCAQTAAVLRQLQLDFPGNLRLVHRHFPQLDVNDKSNIAVQAVEAAGLQGAFWEMHDLLFQRQNEWMGLSADQFRDWTVVRIDEMGLNVNQYSAAVIGPVFVELAQQAWENGKSAGIPFIPFLVINGRIYDGPTDYLSLTMIMRLLLLPEIQYEHCPPLVIDPQKSYLATLQTERGDIVIELFPQLAPLAVNNFVFLARDGWYNGVTFHRVIAGFVAQAGDPSGTGFGGPGYAFENEDTGILFDRDGLVAMANAGRDTNGSQFFITYRAAPELDGDFTIFGRVIEGMEVAESLTPRNPDQNASLPPGDRIITITVLEQ